MRVLTSLPRIDAAMKSYAIRNAICYEVGELLVFSGFAGIDLATGVMAEGSIAEHANASLDCYAYILENMGLGLDNVIKVNCFLQDPADFPDWNETFKTRFAPPLPCRTTVGAPLVTGRIEIEIIAARTRRQDAAIIAV